MSLPHEGWARHYDRVIDRTFGPAYSAFTARTMAVIRARVRPPARVIDFGAGTGRLAVPLARDGYRVTAVDPSRAMLDRLAENAAREGEGGPALDIECVVGGLEAYSAVMLHDLAVCVFSVLGYLLDEDALTRAAAAMAGSVRPGGRLLIDIPGREVFEGFDIETDDVLRYVEIDPVEDGGDLYRYRERTAVRVGEEEDSYHDAFDVRYWPKETVLSTLWTAGFEVEEDLSEQFAPWGADYLLCRRVGSAARVG